MRILLIRHAEPDYTVDSLTSKGRVEAELLSRRLVHYNIRDFYVSPLGRAKDTAVYTLEKLNRTAEALHKLFRPDKINFGAYGDTMHHLHFHLVPKYKDGYEWGGVFAMNPHEKELTQPEYEELMQLIREKL